MREGHRVNITMVMLNGAFPTADRS
jgi:hypothetical protein